MQYTITINQKAFSEHFPGLDLIDAAIYDFIRNFMASSKIEKIEANQSTYYWISYKKIIEELPMIGINSKRALYKRIEKLMDAEILEPKPDNQQRSRSYFKQGRKFDLPTFEPKKDETVIQDSHLRTNGQRGYDHTVKGAMTERSDDQYTSDQYTNDQRGQPDKKTSPNKGKLSLSTWESNNGALSREHVKEFLDKYKLQISDTELTYEIDRFRDKFSDKHYKDWLKTFRNYLRARYLDKEHFDYKKTKTETTMQYKEIQGYG